VISLQDSARLPEVIEYVSLDMIDNNQQSGSMTACEYQFDVNDIRENSANVDHNKYLKSSILESEERKPTRKSRNVKSMISMRDSFRKLDDRSGQKQIMNHLAVDNLKQIGVGILCNSQDEREPDPKSDEIRSILLAITDEHKKVIAENIGETKLSCNFR
jgi:hypothetical protein